MSRKWWWIIAGVVAVGVVLAVVVGLFAYHVRHENSAANEAYANSVCTAIASWEQQVKQIGASGGTSQADIESRSSQVETATQNLADQIKANTSPATIATVAATLKPQYSALVDSAKSAVHSLGDNALPLASAFRRTDACKNL